MALKSSNKVDTNTYELEVTVDSETFKKACTQAYMKDKKNIQLPGFRKGKAPQAMIEKCTVKAPSLKMLLISFIPQQ